MEQFFSNVSLNVRAEPSLSSQTVGWYSKGEPVNVTETNGLWAKTPKGWVKKSRLTPIHKEEAVQTQPEQPVPSEKVSSAEVKKKAAAVAEEEAEKQSAHAAFASEAQSTPVPVVESAAPQSVAATPVAETAASVNVVEATAPAVSTTTAAPAAAAATSDSMGWGWAAGALLVGGGIAAAAGGGGGGGGGSNPPPAAVLDGNLIDSAIAGVAYTTSSGLSGTTDANGTFHYHAGDTVTFKISNVTIGTNLTIPSDGIIFPQDIIGVPRENVTDPEVVKLAQFFQTLDANGDLSDGIQITNVTIPNLVDDPNTVVDWSTVDVADLFDGGTLVGESEAIVHLNETMVSELPNDFTDNEAPTAIVTEATLQNTDNAVVQSSEVGTAYIVKSTVAVTNLADITNAADNEFNSVAITTADSDTNLSLAGLVDGTYKVYTMDAAGNLSEASTNTVTVDTTGATVSSVEITGATGAQNSTLNEGDVLTVTVTMDEEVTVIGSPTITLIIGATEVTATYDADNSTATELKFSYTILAAQTDVNGISIKEDSLSAGTSIKDASGNDAVLTFSAVADNASYMVDTTAPSIVTTEPSDYGVTYGPTGFYAELSEDGTTIVLTADEPIDIGTATNTNFTLDGTIVTITDVEVDPLDSTKINLTLSAPIARDDDPIMLSYDGGLTDLAGNALENFTSEAVRNSAAHTSPISASITSSAFIQQDTDGDQYYISLGGSGFNQFKDSANGALVDSDLKDQFDWSKFVWQIKGDSDTNVSFTAGDIEKVNILTDGTMKIFLTSVKWADLTAIDGLLTSSSTPTADILNISSGFLQDADGVSATATYATVFGDSQYTVELDNSTILPDVYAASVFVSGTGTLNGSTLYAAEVSVAVSGDGDIVLEHMTQLGTLDSLKSSGSLTVQGWGNDGVTVADAGIINSGGDEIQVWIDSANIGNNTLTNFMLLGDNFDIVYDQAAADITLISDDSNGVHRLQYMGDLADGDGSLTAAGFLSGVDEILLDSSIFSSLSVVGDLDISNFVSRAGDSVAQDADDYVIYNESTGGIYYDADADGAGSTAVLLMTLTDMPSIAFDDFKVI